MGKSRRNLFLSAVVSGIALIMGLPGLADIISLAWETTRKPLAQVIPAGLAGLLSLFSLALFVVITYLNYEIYLKGAKKGRKGLLAVVAGVASGVIIGSFILAVIRGVLL